MTFAQQTEYVDFKRVEALIVFNQFEVDSTNYNTYDVSFEMLKSNDSIFLDAIDMRIKHVFLDGLEVKYKNDGEKLIVYSDLKKGNNHKLSFIFFASPKKRTKKR